MVCGESSKLQQHLLHFTAGKTPSDAHRGPDLHQARTVGSSDVMLGASSRTTGKVLREDASTCFDYSQLDGMVPWSDWTQLSYSFVPWCHGRASLQQLDETGPGIRRLVMSVM